MDAATNIDIIRDMNGQNNDTIRLDDAIFVGLTNSGGVLSANQLSTTGVATQATAQIIYNAATGALSYDADGTGGAFSAVQFGILGQTTHPTAASISVNDFVVI